MKKFSKIKMLFLTLLGTFVFMMANTQTCDWTVKNKCDCEPDIALIQKCGSTYTYGDTIQIGAGFWQNETITTLLNQPCASGCNYRIMLRNINNQAKLYNTGDAFCCDGDAPPNCNAPNDCIEVTINSSNREILLYKPAACR